MWDEAIECLIGYLFDQSVFTYFSFDQRVQVRKQTPSSNKNQYFGYQNWKHIVKRTYWLC